MTRFGDAGRKLASMALVAAALTAAVNGQAPQFGTTEKKSWNPFKKDTTKAPSAAQPKVDANDPTSINNRKKPDASFYASWGELEERGGRNPKALELYERALKEDRRNLAALLGAARMKDAANDHEQALNYYRQALRAHPNEAPVYNDLGLSHGRAGQYPQAVQAFQKAIQIDSQRQLYRNNLANVLIDAGQMDQALFQLQQAHGEVMGHYNLGCLLAQKQRHEEATDCFVRAQELDPELQPPADWREMMLAMRTRRPGAGAAPQAVSTPPEATALPISEPAPGAAYEPPPVEVAGAPVEATPELTVQMADPSAAPQEAVASDAPLIDFGQPAPAETLVLGEAAEAGATPSAPLSEPILPEAEAALEPTDVTPTETAPIETATSAPEETAPPVEAGMPSPTFATEEAPSAEPLAPVVRAAPGGVFESGDSLQAEPPSVLTNRPQSTHSAREGRPALPPRPSAVQLYRQHASQSDQAPTPEALFPPYDPNQAPDSYSMEGQNGGQPSPHVGRRPEPQHNHPQKRSARTFKNPFSGWFGNSKKR